MRGQSLLWRTGYVYALPVALGIDQNPDPTVALRNQKKGLICSAAAYRF